MEAKEEEIWTVWQAAVEALRGSVCEREMREENERGMREDDEREANINEREMTHPTNAIPESTLMIIRSSILSPTTENPSISSQLHNHYERTSH